MRVCFVWSTNLGEFTVEIIRLHIASFFASIWCGIFVHKIRNRSRIVELPTIWKSVQKELLQYIINFDFA